MPAPSLQPVPSAPAENDLQRPSGDRARWRLNSVNAPGVDITVTPPASVTRHTFHARIRGIEVIVLGERHRLAFLPDQASGARTLDFLVEAASVATTASAFATMTDDQGRFEFKLPKAGASNRIALLSIYSKVQINNPIINALCCISRD